MDAIIDAMVEACEEDPSALAWFEGFAAADKSAASNKEEK